MHVKKMSLQGLPENTQVCPLPPYNATNFNSANSTIFQTLQGFAQSQPQYPLPVGSDAYQVYQNRANVSYFNGINMQTLAIKNQNNANGTAIPYPQFRTEAERIKYRQGQATTSARTQISGLNPAAPMGVPLSTNYQIINTL